MAADKLQKIKDYCGYCDYLDHVNLEDLHWMIKTIEELRLDKTDYLLLQKQSSIVYDALTFGKISHPFANPYEVIGLVHSSFAESEAE